MKTPVVLAATEQAEQTTLLELGARVRAWRARRGMTRRQLATDSGLSERFLADVEAGKGNVSIVLLLRIVYAIRSAQDAA